MNEAKGDVALPRALLWLAGIVSVSVFFMAMCGLLSAAPGAADSLIFFMLMLDALALWYAFDRGVFFVMGIERRFTGVCKGVGFVGEAVDTRATVRGFIRTIFHNVFVGGFQTARLEKKLVYPSLTKVQGNREAWTALINPLMGQKLEDYTANEASFRLPFDVPYMSFELAGGGFIRVRAGRVQVPEPVEYEELQRRLDDGGGVPARLQPVPTSLDSGAAQNIGYSGGDLLEFARTVNPAALFAQEEARAVLRKVPMAVDIAGHPFYLPVEGNHLLIVGRTGAGKSSWIWSLVFGLRQAREAGLVRLWALDPKKVELGYGMEWWDEYADTVEGMLELLEKAHDAVLERNNAIQGKARKITASPDMPFNVIIIDELAYLSAAVDKKTHERAQRAMRAILWLGRATGYCLVGASQDPTKEVLSERDYYPTKVALGMEAPMVDLVLGKGAYEAGAYCDQIPMLEAGAGSAYVKQDMTGKPVLVRAAWVSDAAIKGGMLPQNQPLQQQAYESGYVPQLDFDGKPRGQFRFRVE
jgi:hypothetical protein